MCSAVFLVFSLRVLQLTMTHWAPSLLAGVSTETYLLYALSVPQLMLPLHVFSLRVFLAPLRFSFHFSPAHCLGMPSQSSELQAVEPEAGKVMKFP